MSWPPNPEHDSSDSEPLPLKRLPPTMNVTLLTQRRGRGRGLLQSTLKMMIFRTMQLNFENTGRKLPLTRHLQRSGLGFVVCEVVHVNILFVVPHLDDLDKPHVASGKGRVLVHCHMWPRPTSESHPRNDTKCLHLLMAVCFFFLHVVHSILSAWS